MRVPTHVIKNYQALHTWTGIVAGLLLFIGFFAGALTMFERTLDAWSQPPITRLAALNVAQMEQLIEHVAATEQPPESGFSLNFDDQALAPMVWGRERGFNVNPNLWLASLDGDGQLELQQQQPSNLATLIDQLHQTAGIPGTLGHESLGVIVMGVASLLYFLALVSGLILWLPAWRKDLFAMRNGRNKKRFWLDGHNAVGIISLPFHLVISITVVVFAFHDVFYGSLQEAVYGDKPMFDFNNGVTQHQQPLQQLAPLSNVIAQIEQRAPDYQLSQLEYLRLNRPGASLRASLEHNSAVVRGPHAAYLLLNPYSGEIIDDTYMPDSDSGWMVPVTSFFALHFGSFGGTPMRWAYFLLGLGGAFLFFSGNLLWLEARRKKMRRHSSEVSQPLSVRVMAKLTVAIPLATVLAVALGLALSKWLALWPQHSNWDFIGLFYITVSLSLFAAWRLTAGELLLTLLRLLSLACALVPMTSLLACVTDIGLWPSSGTGWGVDAVAAVFAVLSFVAAKRLAQRQWAADSLWRVPAMEPSQALAGADAKSV
jgi:uncharacterized iron-regulated membrane protein